MSENLTKRGWKEFQESGLLWFVNRTLHLFGWAIVLTQDMDTGEILGAYPARCKFRGFSQKSESDGFKNLSSYMKDHADELKKEADE